MNGKFNINIENLRSEMYQAGLNDRSMLNPTPTSNQSTKENGIQADLDAREKEKDEYYDQLSDVVEHTWTLTPEQEEQFKAADMILAQNQKDCEQFKGRDGI